MVRSPISPSLQEAYRSTLSINASPAEIDSDVPIQPVAIIAQVSTTSSAQYMQVTDGTDTAQITTAGELHVRTSPPSTSTGRTHVVASWNGLATGGTAYTVTSGKTFHCLGYTMSAGAASIFEIKVAGTTKICISGATNTACTADSLAIKFSATSTQAITIASSGAASYGSIWGYEE